jgi:hypothetical protein
MKATEEVRLDAHRHCPTETPTLRMTAYRLMSGAELELVAASSSRAWMISTNQHFANRCLPLLIANQAGWFILNSHKLQLEWNGADDIAGIRLDYPGGNGSCCAVSHFGYGIVTWILPYLFRTPHGYNLLVRGPSNWPKDGIYPLEGIVEADWSPATFTMNWKVTRPGQKITFEAGEPICMLLPQRRGELETFVPEIQDIHTDADAKRNYGNWRASRSKFLRDLKLPFSEAYTQKWQKEYFRGLSADGVAQAEHQTKLCLRDFEKVDK